MGILDCTRAFIGEVIKGKKNLSVEMCFKIAELLGSTPDFWLRLQAQYDVKMAQRNVKMNAAVKAVHDRVLVYKQTTTA